jgi:GH15 family glucan-1,4-alpha-glucosidase
LIAHATAGVSSGQIGKTAISFLLQRIPLAMTNPSGQPYPSIDDYAFIGNCHCSALISRTGSIDWCCMPEIDSDSCFGRLLDWNKGGHCTLAPRDATVEATRRYVEDTMVLETLYRTNGGEARVTDFLSMGADGEDLRLVRLVDGVRGEIAFTLEVCPRLDFGEIIPHVRKHQEGLFSAVGGNKGLVFRTDIDADISDRSNLAASFTVAAGQRLRLEIAFLRPEHLARLLREGALPPMQADMALERTLRAWRQWSRQLYSMKDGEEIDEQTKRSAIVLKALTVERTGAIAAAPTTSLPEAMGGVRNWDYRFSWVRDSVFIVRALYRLGYETEAERFMRFVQRSSAGSAGQLQIMYGVDGKRRLTEVELDWLEGYRGSRPVRAGNKASEQNQLDVYGEIMELAWVWYHSGHGIDAPYWEFLTDVVDTTCAKWRNRDHGIWEFRGEPRHYVHSKAMCWSAVDFGIRLCEKCGFDAPLERWRNACDEIRATVERQGYDPERGIFVQAFDSPYLDSALLLLPRIGFVAHDDPRMLRTTDAVIADLERDGLLTRYATPDGLPGKEGAFLPCTFWLVACLAAQGRDTLARAYYERAVRCANDVGLFSEEFDIGQNQMLGNFPQGLTHVSQIMARLALEEKTLPLSRS